MRFKICGAITFVVNYSTLDSKITAAKKVINNDNNNNDDDDDDDDGDDDDDDDDDDHRKLYMPGLNVLEVSHHFVARKILRSCKSSFLSAG